MYQVFTGVTVEDHNCKSRISRIQMQIDVITVINYFFTVLSLYQALWNIL